MKIISIILLFTLFSCRTAEFHLKKFHQKGGQIHCDIDTIKVEKIIKRKDGKDSLIYRDSIYTVYKTEIVTRWKTRIEYKTLVKIEKEKTKQIKSENEKQIDIVKSQEKPFPWWILIWAISATLILGFILYVWIAGFFRLPLNDR